MANNDKAEEIEISHEEFLRHLHNQLGNDTWLITFQSCGQILRTVRKAIRQQLNQDHLLEKKGERR